MYMKPTFSGSAACAEVARAAAAARERSVREAAQRIVDAGMFGAHEGALINFSKRPSIDKPGAKRYPTLVGGDGAAQSRGCTELVPLAQSVSTFW